ncbi:NAD(P)/FAD-dependent oxidoreductase [Cryobacterium aureum]|uniref:NAD(P)/FAD-dependent oxidoreductase n=1 Tax=Cryobacterium aureum TaxID=995037 RepID=UPI00196B7DDA|nr:FAD-dependent oxidoreductase [Cryobacterium aureum]
MDVASAGRACVDLAARSSRLATTSTKWRHNPRDTSKVLLKGIEQPSKRIKWEESRLVTHHIVILGAGYAGLATATGIVRRLRKGEVIVTMVNDSPFFVERVRMHQRTVGQERAERSLASLLTHTGIRVVIGRASHVDLVRREVGVRIDGGERTLPYDTLVYALGSMSSCSAVPGAAEHALALSNWSNATKIRDRVLEVAGSNADIVVVGNGATGIEVAAELAESQPNLRVTLIGQRPLGGWLSKRAARRLHRVCERLGVVVRDDVIVTEVRHDSLLLDGGETLAADAAIWALGFSVSPIAREAGIDVDADGRILVDGTLRSTSHPDIYAVGDAGAAQGSDNRPLRMACATAIPMGKYAATAIAARLRGEIPRPFRFRYVFQCLSLGRRDGVIQFLHPDDHPTGFVLVGRPAALYKEAIVRGAALSARGYGRPLGRLGLLRVRRD